MVLKCNDTHDKLQKQHATLQCDCIFGSGLVQQQNGFVIVAKLLLKVLRSTEIVKSDINTWVLVKP